MCDHVSWEVLISYVIVNVQFSVEFKKNISCLLYFYTFRVSQSLNSWLRYEVPVRQQFPEIVCTIGIVRKPKTLVSIDVKTLRLKLKKLKT